MVELPSKRRLCSDRCPTQSRRATKLGIEPSIIHRHSLSPCKATAAPYSAAHGGPTVPASLVRLVSGPKLRGTRRLSRTEPICACGKLGWTLPEAQSVSTWHSRACAGCTGVNIGEMNTPSRARHPSTARSYEGHGPLGNHPYQILDLYTRS